MDHKIALGIAAVSLNILAFYPYIIDTIRGKTKPHLYSWLIWTLVTGIIFVGQLIDGAGPGAWATGATTLIDLVIFILAVRQRAAAITLFDKICLASAFIALPLWYFTDSLVLSVALLVTIEIAGFLPTIAKSIKFPGQETFITYPVSALRCLLSLFALTNFTFITAAYPMVILIICIVMTIILLPAQSFYKRKVRRLPVLLRAKQTQPEQDSIH